MSVKFPTQPIYKDKAHATPRFVQNSIVRDLLDFSTRRDFGLNEIARGDYTREERMQFAQLIGYSLSGYSELSYVSDDSYETALAMFREGKTQQEAELQVYADKLEKTRALVKQLAVALFHIHPDDLQP